MPKRKRARETPCEADIKLVEDRILNRVPVDAECLGFAMIQQILEDIKHGRFRPSIDTTRVLPLRVFCVPSFVRSEEKGTFETGQLQSTINPGSMYACVVICLLLFTASSGWTPKKDTDLEVCYSSIFSYNFEGETRDAVLRQFRLKSHSGMVLLT